MKIRSVVVLNVFCALAAVVMIWEAEVRAYWVWPIQISDRQLERSRVEPTDETLKFISRQRLGLPASYENLPTSTSQNEVARANHLLAGTAEFHRKDPIHVAVPFRASNLNLGTSTQQLYMAGMATVDILLKAYNASADEMFLLAAQEEVAAFANADAMALIPSGFMWNDHALANSMSILAEYWLLVRNRSEFSASLATKILQLAARTADRLEKPHFFTYRTNHGIMQSIGLFQFASAFPTLNKAQAYASIACSRLTDQLRYYVSLEGPVLEHSAGYHEFGRYLLDVTIQLASRNGCSIPGSWQVKLNKARSFSALLRRPDGSIPSIGNTDGADRSLMGVDGVPSMPELSFSLFPVSGYAVFWSGLESWPKDDELSQTVVTWSNFPSRAHKHADDMGVLVWRRGHSWLTNVGYWPYDAPGYRSAQGWAGANAPHFTDEPSTNMAPVQLIGSVDTGRVRAIELERRTSDGLALLRRQIVVIDGASWLIADSVTGTRPGVVERLWTSSPASVATSIDERSFALRRTGSVDVARLSFLGGLAGPPTLRQGELSPFAGWAVQDSVPTPAPAISVGQLGSSSLVLSILETKDHAKLLSLPSPTLAAGSSADAWQVTLSTQDGPIPISWNHRTIAIAFKEGRVDATLDQLDESWMFAKAEILAAYSSVMQKFTRFREYTSYRYQLTIVAAFLLFVQEIMLIGIRWITTWRIEQLRIYLSGIWIVFGFFFGYLYLK
jgi:Heparinase II/III-like protein/Heparinase II/III N-terminus